MSNNHSNVIELGIKNFEKQSQIFDSRARFKVAAKGRRFGLTRGAANDFIRAALKKKFRKGLWIDTVHSNIIRYVERYFIPHLSKLPPDMWRWRKQEKILEMNGSYIDFRSVDNPKNIEGFGYDKFFVNEAGIVLRDEYLWHNAIQPMLWEEKGVEGVIGGTPKGMGLFYNLAMLGKAEDHPEYEFFHFTTFDNPLIDPEVVKLDMKSMPERAIRQEIYAEFLEDTGIVFRGVKEIATAKPQKPISGHLYVMGVDLAKVQDYTVIVVYDRADNHQVYQARINQLEWPFQKKKIMEVCRYYNNALIYMDGTGLGSPVVDDLIRASIPVEPVHLTNETKKDLIERLSLWIEQSRFRMINIPETINEFLAFTYDMTAHGRIQYSAPVGLHDDIVFAHALAIWGLQPVIIKEQSKAPTRVQLAKQRALQGDDFYDPELYEYR